MVIRNVSNSVLNTNYYKISLFPEGWIMASHFFFVEFQMKYMLSWKKKKCLAAFVYRFGILQILQNFKTSVVCVTLSETTDIETAGGERMKVFIILGDVQEECWTIKLSSGFPNLTG